MKTNVRILVAMFVILVTTASDIFAQPGRGRGRNDMKNCENAIPDLTDEQKAKIEKLRVAHLKQMTENRNLMAEKKARLRTLTTVDKPDMKAINETIDQITTLKNQHMKARVAHQLDVRNLLTDTQKVYFDANHGKRGKHNFCGDGDGYRHGKGKGKGMGKGMGNMEDDE